MVEKHRMGLAGPPGRQGTRWDGTHLPRDLLGFGATLEPVAQVCVVPLAVPPRPCHGGGDTAGGSFRPTTHPRKPAGNTGRARCTQVWSTI